MEKITVSPKVSAITDLSINAFTPMIKKETARRQLFQDDTTISNNYIVRFFI
jgi:hypothetical protein